jgi:hypothetical protein
MMFTTRQSNMISIMVLLWIVVGCVRLSYKAAGAMPKRYKDITPAYASLVIKGAERKRSGEHDEADLR